jgi:hypothetical protein
MLAKLQHYPKTLTAWIFISILIMFTHMILPRPLVYNFTPLLLSIVASIYIGFALQDGRPKIMIQEISAAFFHTFGCPRNVAQPLSMGPRTFFAWPVGLATSPEGHSN